MISDDTDTIPPIPTETAAPEADSKAAAAKAAKAARDKRYREAKAAKAAAKPAAKPKAVKAAPKVKAKPAKPAKPAAKRKAGKDARSIPRGERPDTEALILKLCAKRAMTGRELEATGKFDYLKFSGLQEAVKRMFAKGLLVAEETAREGKNGRPPFAYRAK